MKHLFTLTLLLGTLASPVFAQSPWLPERHQLDTTITYVYTEYDEFWRADDRVNPDFNIDQHTGLFSLDYGIFKDLALDLEIGYTNTIFDSPGGDPDDAGLSDTHVGLRYRLVDEFEQESPWIPTLTLRVGGIIEGTYDTGFPFASGDGASGAEASLLAGKVFGDSGFGTRGEVGFRWRAEDVPEDVFVGAGIFQTFWERLTLSVDYYHSNALSGEDIGDPGFTFPQLEEDYHLVQGGIGFALNRDNYISGFYGRVFDGRNTGEKNILGISYTHSF